MSGFDLAQTFYVDPGGCQNAPSVSVTGVDLYFFTKPVQGKARSGIYSPGVTVYMGGVNTDGSPNLNSIVREPVARVEYANINVDATGGTPTHFAFSRPIQIRTGLKACFLISLDGNDPGFQLWYNKAGDKQYNTTVTSSVSSGKVDGHLFKITNGTSLTPQLDSDMTFKLYVAQYTTEPVQYKIKNRAYEILKVSNTVGTFYGGESVYVAKANSSGTVAIYSACNVLIGTNTSFTSLQSGDRFVITDGTAGNTNIRTVASVTNATHMTMDVGSTFTAATGAYTKTVTGSVYFVSGVTDHLVIQDATSNSTIYMSVGDVVHGEDSQAQTTVANIENYPVTAVIPGFVIGTPQGTTVNTSINFANSTLGVTSTTATSVTNGRRTFLNQYPATIVSRTNEVTAATPINSFNGTLTFDTTNPYISPYVDQSSLDMFVESIDINNSSTNEYQGKGDAKARYVSKVINLGSDQLAEDLKAYITCYKPANTDIKVYARFRNSADIETMDVKQWTELTANTTGNVYSSSTNLNDLIEIPFDVPFEPTGTTANGTFTILTGNTIITGTSGAVDTDITVGDVVRVYSPYFSNTYFVSAVTASNTTTFSIASAVSNTSVLGTGFKVDKLTQKNVGYLDVQNHNVLSYFNSSQAAFQGFDSFAIKIVLLSDSNYVYPRVADLRAVAVSA